MVVAGLTAAPPKPLTHHPLRGIALVVIAALLFAAMDTAGKHLMTKFDVPLVAAVRYGLNLVFLVVLWFPGHGPALWRTRRTGLVILRGAALACATFFAGLALQRLPVAEAVSIFYLQVFGVMIAGGLLLKESVSRVGWMAAVAGFAGVLLIARPGGNLELLGVVFALICASVSVVYVLLSRTLAASESTMAMLFYVAIAGSVLFAIMLLIDLKPYRFSAIDVVLLVFMGVASLAAHFLFTSAYRFAPASLLAPFNYFHIAFAVIAGFTVYDHLPDGFALLGIALIALAGAAAAFHSHANRGALPE